MCADADKKGLENYFVAPNLNFGKLLNNYIKKAGVTLAKGDVPTIKKALAGADHVHLMLPFSLSMKTVKIAKENGFFCSGMLSYSIEEKENNIIVFTVKTKSFAL